MSIVVWRVSAVVAVTALSAMVFFIGRDRSPVAVATTGAQFEAQRPPMAGGLPFFSPTAERFETTAQISKAAEIDRLTATGKAADAFKAFEMASQCHGMRLSRRFSPGTFDEKEERDTCGDITALQIRDMSKNLDKAVAGDIPHALISKLYFGPDGDVYAMHQRPDDPYVVEWKRAMQNELTAYLQRTGEPLAMLDMANFYYFGTLGTKDAELAYGYRLAEEEISLRSNDLRWRRSAAHFPAAKSDLAKGLTPEQVEGAKAFALRFVATCCGKR